MTNPTPTKPAPGQLVTEQEHLPNPQAPAPDPAALEPVPEVE